MRGQPQQGANDWTMLVFVSAIDEYITTKIADSLLYDVLLLGVPFLGVPLPPYVRGMCPQQQTSLATYRCVCFDTFSSTIPPLSSAACLQSANLLSGVFYEQHWFRWEKKRLPFLYLLPPR